MKSPPSPKTPGRSDGSKVKGARSASRRSPSKSVASRTKSRIDSAIATELAPAAAIALLEKTAHGPDSPAPALNALAAGVSQAEDATKIRVQLAFDGGEILPVEMSVEAGKALVNGLTEELAAKPKP